MKSLLMFIVFVLSSIQVQATCFTGAACSIDGLKNLEYKQMIENYFEKKIIEPNYVSSLSPILVYNDLFVFNTIV